MLSEAARYYIRRKAGIGLGWRRKISTALPLLVLFLVTAALAFAVTFIDSMASEIDRMIAIMGYGSLWCTEDPSAYIPEDAEVSAISVASAIAYSSENENAAIVKGVESDYFSGFRAEELEIEKGDDDVLNPVVISSAMAENLGLSPGGRFTLLLWENEKGRARPLLCTVSSVFHSVYPQLDSHLIFIPLSLMGEISGYEILLPRGDEPDSLMNALWNEGIVAETYRTMYPALYSNVRSSISILYVILAAVAVLAAFFSSDATEYYIDRDRDEIKIMRLLGTKRNTLRSAYFIMTLSLVAIVSIIGIGSGLILSFLSPFLLEAAADSGVPLLEYYATTFVVEIPCTAILAIFILTVSVSALSIVFSLRRRGVAGLF